MNRYKALLLISLLSLLSACSGDSAGKKYLQDTLNQYYTLWKSKQIETYSIRYQRDCLCDPSYHNSLVVEGEVRSSWDVLTHGFENEDELGQYTTIEYLFESIQFAIDYGADRIYVDFDEEYGYPRVVEIDYESAITGDYIGYEIEAFQEGDYVDTQYYLNIAQLNWESDFLTDYSFTLAVNCLCDLHDEVLSVNVKNGLVLSATDSQGEDVSAQDLLLVPTIADLFVAAQTAIDDEAADIQATFDPLWGHPLDLSVNTTAPFFDDEYAYAVSNVVVDYAVANQKKLDFYSTLWLTEKPEAYHYLVWSPALHDTYQYHVDVIDDQVEDGHFLNMYGEWEGFDPLSLEYVFVEDYFALVEDALLQDADTVIAYYDKQLGNPTEIHIDYDEAVEGDELDYTVHISRFR